MEQGRDIWTEGTVSAKAQRFKGLRAAHRDVGRTTESSETPAVTLDL